MLDRIEFVLGEAMQGIRRHWLMSFAGISTVAVALYLIGGLGYIYVSIQSYTKTLASKYEIQAYFRDGTTAAQIHLAAESARQIAGVGKVVHIPKDSAWKKTRAENPELTLGLENPYPDALKLNVDDLEKTSEIVTAIQALPGIVPEEVMYHDPTQRLLNDIMKLVRWLGGVLGGLLFVTAGVLIYNAIRLTIDARKREIRIMHLVGASYLTVRAPFLIEGMIQGALGGLIAALLLWATHASISSYVQGNMASLHSVERFPWNIALPLLLIGGCGYGIMCSALAIRNPAQLRSVAI